jgi:hypothetical protein
MVNISRGPTFGDFVTILTEGSMQDNMVARLQYKRKYSPLLLLLNVHCERVSLRTDKLFLAQRKRRES